jgi:hypothetical protein
MYNNKLVRKEERAHRDEMNLLEFPIGLVSDRVPIDPATGKEVTEIRFHRKIFDGAVTREQEWIVRGDPAFGGLPRGYDLDIFTAIMSEWSKTSFQHRLVSLGSTYRLLLSTGKRDRPEDYQRVELGVGRRGLRRRVRGPAPRRSGLAARGAAPPGPPALALRVGWRRSRREASGCCPGGGWWRGRSPGSGSPGGSPGTTSTSRTRARP